MSAEYKGRFAPTPSGPLHFGSLVAAVGSYLDARAHQGQWHVRVDDLDPPRIEPGAADAILRCLERFGLHWDGTIVRQSQRNVRYAAALNALERAATVFACACTRSQIAAAGLIGIEGYRYPGTCRDAHRPITEHSALRVSVGDAVIEFDDLIQGHVRQRLEAATGDFVVRRADGVYAYHLACAVDDADSGFTHVVRGVDLMESTPRQIFLQRKLALPTPEYLHLPIAVDRNGHKLSKQTLAAPIDMADPVATLLAVLAFLNHAPPANELVHPDLDTLWQWATKHWQRDLLRNIAKERLAPNLD